jgi:hypothetical protein
MLDHVEAQLLVAPPMDGEGAMWLRLARQVRRRSQSVAHDNSAGCQFQSLTATPIKP